MDTRHNFGFLCLNELSRLYGDGAAAPDVPAGDLWRLRDRGQRPGVARWERWTGPADSEVALLWPLTYMNLSGQAVDFLASHLASMPDQERVLVVVDDLSLPLGQLRLRKRGSSGGHNGLRSIEALFGNGEYPRLRLGIGQPPPEVEVVDFVLSEFSVSEIEAAGAVSKFAATAAAEWSQGVSFESLVGKGNGGRWPGDSPEANSAEEIP